MMKARYGTIGLLMCSILISGCSAQIKFAHNTQFEILPQSQLPDHPAQPSGDSLPSEIIPNLNHHTSFAHGAVAADISGWSATKCPAAQMPPAPLLLIDFIIPANLGLNLLQQNASSNLRQSKYKKIRLAEMKQFRGRLSVLQLMGTGYALAFIAVAGLPLLFYHFIYNMLKLPQSALSSINIRQLILIIAISALLLAGALLLAEYVALGRGGGRYLLMGILSGMFGLGLLLVWLVISAIGEARAKLDKLKGQ